MTGVGRKRAELEAEVQRLAPWNYAFDFNGVTTPIRASLSRNRQLQRKQYIIPPLLEMCGGSFAGKRILDLGCNAGYWALEAIEAGAEFVLGIDGRQTHIDQANFVFDALGIDRRRFHFETNNVFDLDMPGERFDVVLCLGLLYHVAKPIALMEVMAQTRASVIAIDTELSRAPGRYFEVEDESLEEARDSVDYSFALWPTRSALAQLVKQFGYEPMVLKPRFSDWRSCSDYRFGFRRLFICVNEAAGIGATLESERTGALSGLTDIAAWIGWQTWKALGRPYSSKGQTRAPP